MDPFDVPPTIESGFTGATISGNSFTVGSSSLNDGILKFAGPPTSLTLAAPSGAGSSSQLFTVAVPEPATIGLAAAGVAGAAIAFRHRQRARH
jgi:hypothetical protein